MTPASAGRVRERTHKSERKDLSLGLVAEAARHRVRPNGYHASVPELKLEIQMLHDRVLVQLSPEEGERRSTGGIVIPATAQMARRLAWGDVLGVGTNVRNVKVGDRVLFNPEDQLEVEVQGRTYLVMRERDLHAIASERIEHGTGLYL
jgi:chaperonin GroES